MVKWIAPGRTIGIIGGGKNAFHYASAAKKMGYQVGILDPDQDALANFQADWIVNAEPTNLQAVDQFILNSDVVIYANENFNSNLIHHIERSVTVPQGFEVLSMAQDRILQNYFYESSKVNITPYATVLTIEDIHEAIGAIGYPAILKTNQLSSPSERLVIREEADIEKAQALIQRGTCVLESWIEVQHRIIVHQVKTQHGEVVRFPLIEIRSGDQDNTHLKSANTQPDLDPVIEEEINRIGVQLANHFNFVGGMAIEMFVAPNGFIYVNILSTQAHESAAIFDKYTNIGFYEASLRAMVGMEIPREIETIKQVLYLPFEQSQLDVVEQQMQVRADWTFTMYPSKDPADLEGYVILQSKGSLQASLDQLEEVLFT